MTQAMSHYPKEVSMQAQVAVGRRLDKISELVGLEDDPDEVECTPSSGHHPRLGSRIDKLLELISAVSSVIDKYRYDPGKKLFAIKFKDQPDAVYCYIGVPGKVYGKFARAESKGEFFNEQIRGKFPFRLVGG